MAFPCNQFGEQEPGEPKDITVFARHIYKAKFPIMSKCEVNGETGTIDVYRWLRTHSSLFDQKKGLTKTVQWNFAKFLVSSDLQICEYFAPLKEDKEILPIIEKVLMRE